MATVSLARYLFTRLNQLGVRSVHGVPGDFTLKALDHLKPSGLRWIGNCNELNAGYAADGYARAKGIGAVFTTFGVGELSAINAIAGAFSEHSPVVHIVGTPARRLQDSRALVHHSLGDGDFRVFKNMHSKVTVSQVNLVDPHIATGQVDEALQQCIVKSRPVYIELPSDMVPTPVSAARLAEPLDLTPPTSNADEANQAVERVLQRIYSAKQPLILVDGLSARYGIRDEIKELARCSRIPTMCLPFGKGVVDESLENFHGVHVGKYGRLDQSAYTDSADLVLLFGPLMSDNNTCGFRTVPKPQVTVAFNHHSINFGSFADPQSVNVYIKAALQALLERLDPDRLPERQQSLQPYRPLQQPTLKSDETITQSEFYSFLSGHLRPYDTILLANGTPLPGGRDLFLPANAQVVQSSIFLSVGHLLPAALGVGLAKQDSAEGHKATGEDAKLRSRTILLEGDGSFQASGQEISTVIRYKVPLTIFLVNNQGYTYERHIHGMNADYNDVAAWDYLQAPSFFGVPPPGSAEYPVRTWRVRTWGELKGALESREFVDESERGLMMIEVVMETEDVPGKLAEVLKRAGDALEEV